MKKQIQYLILIIGALTSLFCNAASAQTGDDGPYGTGGANDEITTGCDITAYTAGARRTITDISLPSVSAYPLEFSRTSVSRGASQDFPPGQFSTNANGGDTYAPTTWVHSYYWRILSYSCPNNGCDSSGNPRDLTLLYPDGSMTRFGVSTNPPDPYWRSAFGVRERMRGSWSGSTGQVYVLLQDGGQVQFLANNVGTGNTWNFTLSAIIDPFGQVTTIAPQADNSVIVTEPAGRWLHIYYKHPNSSEGNTSDWVVYQVTASDGRSVYYNYTVNLAGTHQLVYTTLTSVNYSWDSNLTSNYTYQTNNDVADQTPLLSTAIDPLYSGPMWRIAYTYYSPSNTSGQIKSENYFDGTTVGAAVASLSNTFPRTETRADGKTRTFTYNALGRLHYYTDWQGHTATLDSYSAGEGFPTQRWDFLNHETDTVYDHFTTVTTQTTFPATPEDAPAGQGVVKKSYTSVGCSSHCDPNNMDTNNEYYLFSTTDEAGNTTYYTRDTNKRVTSIFYPDGGTESFTYTPQFGQIQTHTLKTGDVITYQYDGRGMLQLVYDQEHSAASPNVRYGYDSLDRVNAVTDALNNTANCTYTSRDQVAVVTLPVDPVDGVRHTIASSYNPVDGTLASVMDQLNHQTSYTYDNYRRIKTVIVPGHNTSQTASLFYGSTDSGDDYTYTDSNPTFVKLPSGKESAFTYDENRRVLSKTDAYGTSDAATVSYVYDANGNVTSVKSPNEQPGQQYANQSTTTSYDERNRAYSTTGALGNATSTAFDAYGRKASTTRANGQVTTFNSYDAMNRVLQQTVNQLPDPDAVSKWTYYASGLLHTFQDPALVAVSSTDSYSYIYDTLGRKTSLTYPKASPSATPTAELWHYDTAGHNDTFTNRNGKVLTNSYDSLNRPYYSSWNDGLTPAVTIGYDVANRPTSVTNVNAAITWSYFNDNLLSTETATYADNVARPLAYTYDADGNEATMSGLTYTYTNRNQLQTIVNGSNTLVTYGYDPNGNLSTRVPNNITSSSYSYDGLDRVTHVGHAFNGITKTFDYAYDFVGNMKWAKRDGGNGDVFGYDQNDQSASILLNVANPDTTSPGNQTVFYDAGGNRTAFQAQGLNDSYVSNPLNQYTTRDSVNAIYDPSGRMTTGFDGSTYTFDALGRVLTATKGTNTDSFQYDGLGRQVSITTNGVTTYNYYDGWSLFCQWAPGATKIPLVTYIYGAGGLVEHLLDPNHVRQGQSPYCYYYQDGRGSTSQAANSSGSLVENYRYDLQGSPLFFGPRGNQLTVSAYGVQNLFNGERWYGEIGLYDLRHRFYSPDIGRFIQADPSGHDGGDNLYRYGSNNPLKNSDPMGLDDGPTGYYVWNPFGNAYDNFGNLDLAAMQYPPGYYSFDNGVAGLEATFAQEHSFILSPTLPTYTWNPGTSDVRSSSLNLLPALMKLPPALRQLDMSWSDVGAGAARVYQFVVHPTEADKGAVMNYITTSVIMGGLGAGELPDWTEFLKGGSNGGLLFGVFHEGKVVKEIGGCDPTFFDAGVHRTLWDQAMKEAGGNLDGAVGFSLMGPFKGVTIVRGSEALETPFTEAHVAPLQNWYKQLYKNVGPFKYKPVTH